jgi:hypothetical protein
MSSFHFCLSAAKNRSSFQLLPTSLVTDLLQLVLGLPLFLLPWGSHSRAAFGTFPSSFLIVWPIHLNFLFLIYKFISSWPFALHKSLLEIIFGHHILNVEYRRAENHSTDWEKCGYLHRFERKLRSRFSKPVWNQYFYMDVKHGLSQVKFGVRYKLL